jgi:hypothetical protein
MIRWQFVTKNIDNLDIVDCFRFEDWYSFWKDVLLQEHYMIMPADGDAISWEM